MFCLASEKSVCIQHMWVGVCVFTHACVYLFGVHELAYVHAFVSDYACLYACVSADFPQPSAAEGGFFPPAIREPSNFLLSNSPARLNWSGGLGSLRNVNWKQWPWMLSCYYLT